MTLDQFLQSFASQVGGVSSSYYQTLYQAIYGGNGVQASPNLLNDLNKALAQGEITGISVVAGNVGQYVRNTDSPGGTIVIGLGYLNTQVLPWGENAAATFANLLTHEVQHALDSNLLDTYTGAFSDGIKNIAKGSSSDVTNVLKTFLQGENNLEGSSVIAGWDDALPLVTGISGFNNYPFSVQIFQPTVKDGELIATPTINPGVAIDPSTGNISITQNSTDGSIDPDQNANVVAEGKSYALLYPSINLHPNYVLTNGGEFIPQYGMYDYQNSYAANAFRLISAYFGSRPFTVDFAQLGLTVGQLALANAQGQVEPQAQIFFTDLGPCIVNDGAGDTFVFSTSHVDGAGGTEVTETSKASPNTTFTYIYNTIGLVSQDTKTTLSNGTISDDLITFDPFSGRIVSENVSSPSGSKFTYGNSWTTSFNGAGDAVVAGNGTNTSPLAVQSESAVSVTGTFFGVSNTVFADSDRGSITALNNSLGAGLVSTGQNIWSDGSGTQYQFTPGIGRLGTLAVTGGSVGAGNSIQINDFDLSVAQWNPNGFLGIQIPPTLTISSGVSGNQGSATLNEGDQQSFTVSLSTSCTTAQTVNLTLVGNGASDFALAPPNGAQSVQSLGGTVSITIPAGEQSVTLALVNTGDVGGNASFQLNASLVVPGSNSIPAQQPLTINYTEGSIDPFNNTLQAPTTTGTFQFRNFGSWSGYVDGYNNSGPTTGNVPNYPGPNPQAPDGENVAYFWGDGQNDSIQTNDTLASSQASQQGIPLVSGIEVNDASSNNDVIVTTGSLSTGVGLGNGDNFIVAGSTGGTSISAGTGKNVVQFVADSAGNAAFLGAGTVGDGSNLVVLNQHNAIVLAGDGDNQIYGDSLTSLNFATALGERSGSATGQQGALLSALDGDNTIVGTAGNDAILVGGGNDLIIAGPGDDTITADIDVQSADYGWSVTETTVADGSGYTDSFTYNGIDYTDVTTGTGDDTIFGGAGNSYIQLSDGNNYVDCGTGNDTVFGGNGDNTILGGAGDVYFAGASGNDYIDGESGNDTIWGGGGNNTIFGGSGNDALHAGGVDKNNPDPMNWMYITNGNNYVEAGSGDTTIWGAGGNDTLIGTTGKVTIFAGDGNEYIYGGSGDASINGGGGKDTIDAGDGNDTIFAGKGDTTIYGGNGTDAIQAGSGNDVIFAGDGGTSAAPTQIFGGSGNATIYGGLGTGAIYAGSGNTTIYGGMGDYFLAGGSGNSVLYVGGAGTDTSPEVGSAGTGHTTIYGGDGGSFLQDSVYGAALMIAGSGNTSLVGSGADTMVAGTGLDVMQGGSGTTRFVFNSNFGNDTVLSSSGSDVLEFDASFLPIDLTVTATMDTSGAPALLIESDSGSILVDGGLAGNIGNVIFDDPETFTLSQFLAQTNTEDSTVAGANGNLIFNIHNGASIVGGSGSDTITAWGNNDTLVAGPSGSQLYAGGANSIVYGGTGVDTLGALGTADTLYGGTGIETFEVRDPSAVIQAQPNNGLDAVLSWASYTLPMNVSKLALQGGADLSATGNSTGGVLVANDGNDTLQGHVGVVTMIGGIGNDTFVVDNALDVVQVGATHGNDTVLSSVSFTVPTSVQALKLTAAGMTATGGTTAAVITEVGGNATLQSTTANDTLVAGLGDDSLVAGSGTDLLIGGSGISNDTLVAGTGTSTLQGGSGPTTYYLPSSFGTAIIVPGSSSSQTIQFAAGDTSNLQATAALLNGAPVLQITDSANTSGTVYVVGGLTGAPAVQVKIGASTLTLNQLLATASATTVPGTNGANLILSTANGASLTGSNTAADTLSAWGTNDTLRAGTGANQIYAFGATDSVVGGSSSATLGGFGSGDTLVGGTGNTLFIVNGSQTVTVGAGHGIDTVQSSASYSLQSGIDTLILTGNSTAVGQGNNDPTNTLIGNAGDHTLVAGTGNDTLIAGSGLASLVGGTTATSNDLFIVNNYNDTVSVGSTHGNDTIQSSANYSLSPNVTTLVLTGNASLSATGNGLADMIIANAGGDVLTAISTTAATTLVGGAGNDLFIVNNTNDKVSVGTSQGSDTIQSSATYTLPANVDTLVLTGTTTMVGAGNNDTSNTLYGSDGAHTLIAGTGSDTLIAGSGAGVASLVGGAGNDLFIVKHGNDTVSVGAVHGNDTIQSLVNYTLPTGVDTLILSGSGPLQGNGNSDTNNTLIGSSGNHTLTAGTGNDTLIAGSGAATLIGGNTSLSNDLFVVNSATDVIALGTAHGNDTVQSSVSYALQSGVDTLMLIGSDSLSGTGNNDATNVLIANNGSTTLTAGNFNDTLISGTGFDVLVGGTVAGSNDVFVVNNSGDVVQVGATHGTDTVQSSVSFVVPENVQYLTLTGPSLEAIGNDQSNVITATSGNNILIAGTGLATLTGGTGSDTFIVNNASDVVSVGAVHGTDTVYSSASFTVPTNVQSFVLTAAGTSVTGGTTAAVITETGGNATLKSATANDTLVAGAGDDSLVAGSGADLLIGGIGNDTLTAGSGTATLQGGSGPTTYSLPTTFGTAIVVPGSNATQTIQFAAGTTSNLQAAVALLNGAPVLKITDSASPSGSVYVMGALTNALNMQVKAGATTTTLSQLIGTAPSTVVGVNGASLIFNTATGATLAGGSSADTISAWGNNDTLRAGTGANQIYAFGTTDSVVGNTGSATLAGFGSGDTLVGGTGNTLFVVNGGQTVTVGGGYGNDTVQSSATYSLPTGVDTLILTGNSTAVGTGNGDAAGNVLVANSGADTLKAGSASAVTTLVGGSGTDLFVVNNRNDVVQEAYVGTNSTIQSSVSYSLPANVDYLTLSVGAGAVSLSGNNDAGNYIVGSDGNDTLYAGSGSDTLKAGSGPTVFVPGTGNDRFVINSTNDVFSPYSNSSTYGNDTIQSSISYTLPHNIDTLVLTGTGALTGQGNTDSGNLIISNTSGSATLTAKGDNDTLIGGSGNDSLTANGAGDVLVAGTGNDTLTGSNLGTTFIFNQGFGNDRITYNYATNNIQFGPGIEPTDIQVSAGFNQLVLSGGGGSLVIDYSPYGVINENQLLPPPLTSVYFADAGTVSLKDLVAGSNAGSQTVLGSNSGFIFDPNSNESIRASGFHAGGTNAADYILAFGNNDTIYASDPVASGNNNAVVYAEGDITTVYASSGSNALVADGDNDVIYATSGYGVVAANGSNDTLIGGDSNLILEVNNSSAVTQLASWLSSQNTEEIDTTVNYVLPTNFVNLKLTAANIVGTSNSVGGTLTANYANDTLIGGFGNDTLYARGQDDVLVAGSGHEVLELDYVNTVIQLGSNPGNDTILSNVSYTLPTNAVALTLNAYGLVGTGNSGDDLLTSFNYGQDTLIAGAGNDTLISVGGPNTLVGGTGNNLFIVNNLNDVVTVGAVHGNDTIQSSVSFTLPANVATLVLTGTSSVVGTAGNSMNDLIIANAGPATLVSGTGNDTLVAGAGPDTFRFNSNYGSDVITGPLNNETIQFSAANATLGALTFTPILTANSTQPSLVISGSGGAVTINGGLVPGAIGSVVFGDGTTKTIKQLIAGGNFAQTTVTGTSGGHLIISGNDSIAMTVGGSAKDMLSAWGDNDTLTASVNGAQIYAGGNYNKVQGGGGNDTLIGMGSGDTLIAAGGSDTLDAIGLNDVLVDSAASGHNNIFQLDNITASILAPTANADTVLASVSDYTLSPNLKTLVLVGTNSLQATGNSLNDTIIANGAGDTLTAGAGSTAALFIGGSGNDVFQVNSGADTVQSQAVAGSDTVLSTASSYTVPQNVSYLTLTGTGPQTATGNGQGAVITANSGNYDDTLFGGAGNDTLIGGPGNDSLVAGSGQQVLISQGNWNIGNNNTLVGGLGIDTFIAETYGGVFIINNPADVIQNSGFGETTVESSVSCTLPAYVQFLTLTGSDSLVASDGGQNGVVITSNSGQDTLIGTGSSTTFVINRSDDTILASASNAGTDEVQSSASYSLPQYLDHLYLTGSGLVGWGNNDSSNYLEGSTGDTLNAGSGGDYLTGSGVTVVVGTGSDTIDADGGDTYIFSQGLGATFINVRAYWYYGSYIGDFKFGSDINLGDLTLSVVPSPDGFYAQPSLTINGSVGGSNDRITLNNYAFGINDGQVDFANGTSFAISDLISEVSHVVSSTVLGAQGSGNVIFNGDTAASIIGGSGVDTIYGLGANDTLSGGQNADTLFGGRYDETFIVNNGNDSVSVGQFHGNDTLYSSVSYTLPANIDTLILSGADSLSGTGNSNGDATNVLKATGNYDTLSAGTAATTLIGGGASDSLVGGGAASVLIANGNSDTLVAGAGLATLTGYGSNETFVINRLGDVIQVSGGVGTDAVQSSVSYSLPSTINSLVITAASKKGIANNGNDTLSTTASGIVTLVGGTQSTSNDLFIINNPGDVISVGATHGNDTIQSSASFTLAPNVGTLVLTAGNSKLTGTSNGGNDTLVANAVQDTLFGGAGNDVFVVNYASDVVSSAATSHGNDTVRSSAATYTLPANVQTLVLNGSSTKNLTGVGNGSALTNLIIANGGNDTLTGGTGIAVLEGGTGQDSVSATGNQAALLGGDNNDTLTGGAYKDFFAPGKGNDVITTGATANVISINVGDGADTINPTTNATNVLSLGGGINPANLTFSKSANGNDLILSDGAGDTVTFANWYVGSTNKTVVKLQLIQPGTSSPVQVYDFLSLATQFTGTSGWQLSNGMPSALVASSSTQAYGGDLAYYYGANGNLTGLNVPDARSTLTDTTNPFGTSLQTINAFSGVSGGPVTMAETRQTVPSGGGVPVAHMGPSLATDHSPAPASHTWVPVNRWSVVSAQLDAHLMRWNNGDVQWAIAHEGHIGVDLLRAGVSAGTPDNTKHVVAHFGGFLDPHRR
jgi:Ca2+-binding RTX toxin-like protein